ncbi:hypothetical protein MNEG_5019 [Monoraphidium neglectum]|uniref:Uncharacterized protein n=1 Tax=Monoraphidium neglectum TaxID=145388 RepID=A0A0D2L7V4_9CHLO|nr:hypothetical protein MNEG_5019 [Monoraphidium neglectum]KIZ02939.1 hypothetical protein MNEG_5019 [Monoraphidium neglectum]|eukprot:XP_013901958.1 hypothetical protein MNEG_5019 [Monoraphidium neglectum]
MGLKLVLLALLAELAVGQGAVPERMGILVPLDVDAPVGPDIRRIVSLARNETCLARSFTGVVMTGPSVNGNSSEGRLRRQKLETLSKEMGRQWAPLDIDGWLGAGPGSFGGGFVRGIWLDGVAPGSNSLAYFQAIASRVKDRYKKLLAVSGPGAANASQGCAWLKRVGVDFADNFDGDYQVWREESLSNSSWKCPCEGTSVRCIASIRK